jgi:hypothetical protein
MSLPILGVIDTHQHYRRTAVPKFGTMDSSGGPQPSVSEAEQGREPQRERARALNRSKPAQGQAGAQDRERFERLEVFNARAFNGFSTLYVRDGPRLRIYGLTIGIHFPER